MDWYKAGLGRYQALEWALVLAIVCVFGGLLAGGLCLFVVRVAGHVVAALGLG